MDGTDTKCLPELKEMVLVLSDSYTTIFSAM